MAATTGIPAGTGTATRTDPASGPAGCDLG
jgi:hypothetical protein